MRVSFDTERKSTALENLQRKFWTFCKFLVYAYNRVRYENLNENRHRPSYRPTYSYVLCRPKHSGSIELLRHRAISLDSTGAITCNML